MVSGGSRIFVWGGAEMQCFKSELQTVGWKNLEKIIHKIEKESLCRDLVEYLGEMLVELFSAIFL